MSISISKKRSGKKRRKKPIPERTIEEIKALLATPSELKITRAISPSTGQFVTGRYED